MSQIQERHGLSEGDRLRNQMETMRFEVLAVGDASVEIVALDVEETPVNGTEHTFDAGEMAEALNHGVFFIDES